MNHSNIDAAEAELQQELREMFAVDTQQHLETYFSTVGRLQPQSWTADVRDLYRTIHTIKGGAVTVAADAILHVAAALEDLLSELRYLEIAPELTDGNLGEILLEAGELLTSSIEIDESGTAAVERVRPTIARLEQLRAIVKQLYLPEWSELKQVHQEFAEQGFDLVILNLEMYLGKLPRQGIVPQETISIAGDTLAQLTQIGVDLELAADWQVLIKDCEDLLSKPNCQLWGLAWDEYFQLLKNCVKNGGKFTDADITALERLKISSRSLAESFDLATVGTSDNLANLSDCLDNFLIPAAPPTVGASLETDLGDLDDFFLEPESTAAATLAATASDLELASAIDDFFATEDNISNSDREWEIGSDLMDMCDVFDRQSAPSPTDSVSESIDNCLAKMEFTEDVPDRSIDALTANTPSATDLQDLANVLEFIAEIDNTTCWDGEGTIAQDATLVLDETYAQEALDGEGTIAQDATLVLDETYAQEALDGEGTIAQDATLVLDETYAQEALDSEETIGSQVPTAAIAPAQSEPRSAPAVEPSPVVAIERKIPIPVPLERLDKSAQQVVDSLLAARAVSTTSTQLQSQLVRLSALTRENARFVARLRQLQDDYALLRHLSDDRQDPGNNVTLERYRQGYTTINRLLENILRLSELGQEIETTTYQHAIQIESLDRSILNLKDGIETSRLVPFRNLTLRAKAIVRDLANRYGKPVEPIVTNEHLEIDAGVIQQLEPAVLHLIRNAYDHGLEPVEQRLAAGKPARGQIRISLQNQGNLYVLTIADDGGGIDADRIYQIAKAKGVTDLNLELLDILCQPGFSSSETVTEISGRGVGMDVVRSQVTSLGGKLTLNTQPGRGTTFTIVIPAPQLLIPCVLFQVGDRTIGLPTNSVLETTLLSAIGVASNDDLGSACAYKLTSDRGEIPGYDLYEYWQPESANRGTAHRMLPETAIAIRTRQQEDTSAIWAIADNLVGQSKLLITPLPAPLVAPVGLLGVSLQPDGRSIAILDPIALSTKLASSSLQQTLADTLDMADSIDLSSLPCRLEDRPQPTTEAASGDLSSALRELSEDRTQPTTPTILIVDDAAMIRRRLEASLNTYGFITHTCNDGLEALNWLQTNQLPDLMITDVEMPNMDGFTLIDRLRQSQIEMPILVVSSRLSEEWGKEARRLGATDYLNKGFSTSELIQKVNAALESGKDLATIGK